MPRRRASDRTDPRQSHHLDGDHRRAHDAGGRRHDSYRTGIPGSAGEPERRDGGPSTRRRSRRRRGIRCLTMPRHALVARRTRHSTRPIGSSSVSSRHVVRSAGNAACPCSSSQVMRRARHLAVDPAVGGDPASARASRPLVALAEAVDALERLAVGCSTRSRIVLPRGSSRRISSAVKGVGSKPGPSRCGSVMFAILRHPLDSGYGQAAYGRREIGEVPCHWKASTSRARRDGHASRPRRSRRRTARRRTRSAALPIVLLTTRRREVRQTPQDRAHARRARRRVRRRRLARRGRRSIRSGTGTSRSTRTSSCRTAPRSTTTRRASSRAPSARTWWARAVEAYPPYADYQREDRPADPGLPPHARRALSRAARAHPLGAAPLGAAPLRATAS